MLSILSRQGARVLQVAAWVLMAGRHHTENIDWWLPRIYININCKEAIVTCRAEWPQVVAVIMRSQCLDRTRAVRFTYAFT